MSQTYRVGPLNFTGSQAVLSASLDVSGSGRFTNGLTVTGSFTVHTGSTEFQILDTGTKIGNSISDTHTVTGSLNVSGSSTISGSFIVFTQPPPGYTPGGLRVVGSAVGANRATHFYFGDYPTWAGNNPNPQFHLGDWNQSPFLENNILCIKNNYLLFGSSILGSGFNESRLLIGVNTGSEYSIGVNYPSSSNNYFYINTQIDNPNPNTNTRRPLYIGADNIQFYVSSSNSFNRAPLMILSKNNEVFVSGSGRFTNGLTVTGSLDVTGSVVVTGSFLISNYLSGSISIAANQDGNSRLLEFRNPGNGDGWGGGYLFYGGHNNQQGVPILRILSNGNTNNSGSVGIGNIGENILQNSSVGGVRLAIQGRRGAGEEVSYEDSVMVYASNTTYTSASNRLFGIGMSRTDGGGGIPVSISTSSYGTHIGFQVDPLINGWGSTMVLSAKNDSGSMQQIMRLQGKNSAVIISGSFTVSTGSTEFQVLDTGTKIGNAITDLHTITGSVAISGSTLTFNNNEFTLNSTVTRIGNASTDRVNITGSVAITNFLTASAALISGSGDSRLRVIGSGSNNPIMTVGGSSGQLLTVTDSLSGVLFSVNNISALPILVVNSDDTVRIGTSNAMGLYTSYRVITTTANTEIYKVSTGSYDGLFIDYTIRSGSNARVGQLMSMWSGSQVNYTETSASQFGDTSGFTFAAYISQSFMNISSSATTNGWDVKTIIRSI